MALCHIVRGESIDLACLRAALLLNYLIWPVMEYKNSTLPKNINSVTIYSFTLVPIQFLVIFVKCSTKVFKTSKKCQNTDKVCI